MGKKRRKGPTYLATFGKSVIGKKIDEKGSPNWCYLTGCVDCGGGWFAKKESRLPKKYRRGKKRRIHREG